MHLALNFQRVDPTKGGAETYVADLCGRLIAAGHRVDLYAESWREGVLPGAVRCVAVPVSGRGRAARVASFGRNSETALGQTQYDCTVGFINTWAHDIIIPQGGVIQASLDANSRRHPAGWRRSAYRLGKLAQPKHWTCRAIERVQYDPSRGARVVAVSALVKEHLQQYHSVPRSRITVIPNAIDAERLKTAHPGAVRAAFRSKHGIAPDDLAGLFVGHNFALKGLGPLLRAFAERRRRDPAGRPIRLLVCGGGSLGPFRRLTARLGLADTVHLIGFEPDIRGGYWASDFFVSPTYYDPCSLVVFEALACGLPVITTACNGASEVMTDGEEGYVLTAPDAIGEIVTALDRMTDDARRARLSEHAMTLGRAQSLDNHVARLIKLFEDVAATKERRVPHSRRRVDRRAIL